MDKPLSGMIAVARPPNAPDDPALIEEFPDHARLIGYVVTEWTRIEFALMYWLNVRLNHDELLVTTMVYAADSSRARVNMMRNALLVLASSAAQQEVIQDLCAQADSFRVQRNALAHALLGKEVGSGELCIAELNPDRKPGILRRRGELEEQFKQMKRLNYRIWQQIEEEKSRQLLEVRE